MKAVQKICAIGVSTALAVGMCLGQGVVPVDVPCASIKLAHASAARTIKASGWYQVDSYMHLQRSGSYLKSDSCSKHLSTSWMKSGYMTLSKSSSFFKTKRVSGPLKFKVAGHVSYAKFTISGKRVAKVHSSTRLSRSAFFSAAKRKSVYMLFVNVKGGKVAKAMWMPLSSAEMLD